VRERHFTQRAIRYAASVGLPLADVLVPLSGIIATVGGVGILIGYRAKVGAWLVVLFLVPVTLIMHRFWGLSDPLLAEMQQINFMKNLALLGGALLIAYFGSGPLSLLLRFALLPDRLVGKKLFALGILDLAHVVRATLRFLAGNDPRHLA